MPGDGVNLSSTSTDADVEGGRSTGQSIGSKAVSTSIFCGGARDLQSVPSDGFQGFHAAAGEGDEQEEEEGEDKSEMHFLGCEMSCQPRLNPTERTCTLI